MATDTPATKKSATKKSATKKSATTKSASTKSASGFTAEERAAMKARAEELKSSGRGGAKKADEAQACLDKIAEMSQPDRRLAERVHAIVTEAAPDLDAKTWYGMPAYARDGKVVLFFKPAEKFKARYATLGFSDQAHLDDGNMWPAEFAVADIGSAEEERIAALVTQAES